MNVTVTQPSKDELEKLGVFDWPIWTCEVSTFDWHYDQKETCYLLAGQVTVLSPDRTQQVRFGAGDLVVFAADQDCVWQVASPVKKHYRFG